MNALVHTAQEGGGLQLASFGSGNRAPGGRAAARARGRGGRQVAPAGAHRALRGAAARAANTPGRGRAQRRAILQEIDQAAARRRGGPRLTNAQIAEFRGRLARFRARG
jgi:hypothetical protein